MDASFTEHCAFRGLGSGRGRVYMAHLVSSLECILHIIPLALDLVEFLSTEERSESYVMRVDECWRKTAFTSVDTLRPAREALVTAALMCVGAQLAKMMQLLKAARSHGHCSC